MPRQFTISGRTEAGSVHRGPPPALHPHDAHGAEGESRSSAREKLPYASPRIQSAVMDGRLPPDVVAEWSGVLPEKLDAPIATGTGTPGSTSGADACRLPRPVGRRRWWELPASLRRRADVLEYPIDNEALLYDPTLQALYCLNETAFYVWRQCNGRSPADLASDLARSYDVENDIALDHVTNAVEMLAIGGLFAEEP